jgi:hypothetical protein
MPTGTHTVIITVMNIHCLYIPRARGQAGVIRFDRRNIDDGDRLV